MSTRDTYCSSLFATATAVKFTMQATPLQPNGALVEADGSAQLSSQMQTVSPIHPTSLALHSPPIQLAPPTPHNSVLTQPPFVEESFAEPPTLQPPIKQENSLQQLHPPSQIPENAKVVREHVPVLSVAKESEAKPMKIEPPAPVEEDAASDVLSNLLGFVFLCIFRVCYFLLIKLPIHVMVLTTVASVAGAILSIMWLCFANDNGAEELGANFGYGFNRPGIQ